MTIVNSKIRSMVNPDPLALKFSTWESRKDRIPSMSRLVEEFISSGVV